MISAEILVSLFLVFMSSHLIFGFTYNSSKRSQRATSLGGQNAMELDNEESLKALFQKAVVLQRSGSHDEAREEYERFIKAAKSTNQAPKTFAEVYNNLAAIELRSKNREMAKHYFQEALKHRKLGNAYVNLALLALQEGSQSLDPRVGLSALAEAKELCEKALELKNDKQAIAMAEKLLSDIDEMQKNECKNDK
jgi:tetratricopeptide (TPR) repeat protein